MNTSSITADKLWNLLIEFFEKSKFIKQWPFFDISRLKSIQYIVFSGSSWSWKTTQVTTINNMVWACNKDSLSFDNVKYYIATRYITRPWRKSDNDTWFIENISLTKDEFSYLQSIWEIEISWNRDIWSDIVDYGFESLSKINSKIISNKNTIIVYSGNNDMLRKFNDIDFCRKNKSKFFHIHVTAEDNDLRFSARSQDVVVWDAIQFQKRMSDLWLDVLSKSDIIIQNKNNEQNWVQDELKELINIIFNYSMNSLWPI